MNYYGENSYNNLVGLYFSKPVEYTNIRWLLRKANKNKDITLINY